VFIVVLLEPLDSVLPPFYGDFSPGRETKLRGVMKFKSITIYHNPRCSKSRQTLQLIRDHGIEPTIVNYLESPPDVTELRRIVKQSKLQVTDFVRRREQIELGLPTSDDEETLLKQMAANPKILERPIVVCGNKACLGRPPENVLDIL